MSDIQWKKIKEEVAFDSFRPTHAVTYELPSGAQKTFDIIEFPKAVLILPLDENGDVVIAKQYRPGPEKVCYDLPGGLIDGEDSPEETAERELLEETGYRGDLEYVGGFIREPYIRGDIHICVAKNCRLVAEQRGRDKSLINVEKVSLEEFKGILRRGELCDATGAYMALDYLGLL